MEAAPLSGDLVPADVLQPPSPRERRRLDRDLCADLIDPLLRRLARQEALCRRVLGRLARPFLRRRAHLRLGFVRVDDYARERLGLSGRELQDLARVVERLADLPTVDRAFADGALAWSHLRLLVSVATSETESAWLAQAQHLTVRALDAAIAAVRGAPADPDERAVDGEPGVRFRLACPRRVRRLWRHATALASRMAGARLPAWRAAEAIAAEGLASDAGDGAPPPERSIPPPPAPAPKVEALAWGAISEALPEAVEKLTFLADSIDPFQLDARLRAAIRALQQIDFQTGRLLRLVVDLRLCRAFGAGSFADYVRDRLGFSGRKARALVALDRRLAEFPALAAAYRDGRLSFARALTLLPVLHPSTEAAWVARAQEVTLRRLGDLVEWALEAGDPDHPLLPPAPDATLVLPELSALQMCARGCDAEIVFHGPASVLALFRAAIQAFTPRGAPAWEGLERLLLHAMHGIHGFRIKVDGVAPHDLTWQIGLRTARPPLFRTHGERYLDGAP